MTKERIEIMCSQTSGIDNRVNLSSRGGEVPHVDGTDGSTTYIESWGLEEVLEMIKELLDSLMKSSS